MKVETGRITNENAAALLAQGLTAIRAGDAAFDLSAVKECNSAAVAMVLAWQRAAQARGTALELNGIPANLSSLAKLYGVEPLIVPPHRATP